MNQLAPTRIPSPKRSPGKKTVSQRLALSDDLSDLAQIDLGISPTPTRRLQICNQSEVNAIQHFTIRRLSLLAMFLYDDLPYVLHTLIFYFLFLS